VLEGGFEKVRSGAGYGGWGEQEGEENREKKEIWNVMVCKA